MQEAPGKLPRAHVGVLFSWVRVAGEARRGTEAGSSQRASASSELMLVLEAVRSCLALTMPSGETGERTASDRSLSVKRAINEVKDGRARDSLPVQRFDDVGRLAGHNNEAWRHLA